MINKVILIGNLGRAPEMRSTSSDVPVANFSLATNRRWKDSNGERQEQTEWHSVVCFGRQAEVAGQYLTRGRLVYVEGRLQTRTWEDETGVTRSRTEIVCEDFQMLGQRPEAEAAGAAEGEPAAEEPEPQPAAETSKTKRRRRSAKKH